MESIDHNLFDDLLEIKEEVITPEDPPGYNIPNIFDDSIEVKEEVIITPEDSPVNQVKQDPEVLKGCIQSCDLPPNEPHSLAICKEVPIYQSPITPTLQQTKSIKRTYSRSKTDLIKPQPTIIVLPCQKPDQGSNQNLTFIKTTPKSPSIEKFKNGRLVLSARDAFNNKLLKPVPDKYPQCTICHQKMFDKNSLTNHILNYHTSRTCPICKIDVNLQNYTQHWKTHTRNTSTPVNLLPSSSNKAENTQNIYFKNQINVGSTSVQKEKLIIEDKHRPSSEDFGDQIFLDDLFEAEDVKINLSDFPNFSKELESKEIKVNNTSVKEEELIIDDKDRPSNQESKEKINVNSTSVQKELIIEDKDPHSSKDLEVSEGSIKTSVLPQNKPNPVVICKEVPVDHLPITSTLQQIKRTYSRSKAVSLKPNQGSDLKLTSLTSISKPPAMEKLINEKLLSSIDAFNKKLRDMVPDKYAECNVCHLKLINETLLRNHMLDRHPTTSCSICKSGDTGHWKKHRSQMTTNLPPTTSIEANCHQQIESEDAVQIAGGLFMEVEETVIENKDQPLNTEFKVQINVGSTSVQNEELIIKEKDQPSSEGEMAMTSSDFKKHSRNLCCFTGCRRSKDRYPTLRFFSFPVNRPSICEAWITNCANKILDTATKKALNRRVVCEKHFEEGCFLSTLKTRLHACAVPTVLSLQEIDDVPRTVAEDVQVAQEPDPIQTPSEEDDQQSVNLIQTTHAKICQLPDISESPGSSEVHSRRALFATPSNSSTNLQTPLQSNSSILVRQQMPKKILMPGEKKLLASLSSLRNQKRKYQQQIKRLQNKQTTITKEIVMSTVKSMLPKKVSKFVCMQLKQANVKKKCHGLMKKYGSFSNEKLTNQLLDDPIEVEKKKINIDDSPDSQELVTKESGRSSDSGDVSKGKPPAVAVRKMILAKQWPYSCSPCNKYFVSDTALGKHMKKHLFTKSNKDLNSIKNKPSSSKLQLTETNEVKQCKTSNLTSEESQITDQIEQDHLNLLFHTTGTSDCAYIVKKEKTKVNEEWFNNSHNWLKCEFCHQAFKYTSTYLKHVSNHYAPLKPNTCSICGKHFSSEYYLRTHTRVCQSGPRICKICGKSFHSAMACRKHSLFHLKMKKKEVCKICNKVYPKKSLKPHINQVHNKQFKCKTCNKLFGRQPLLKDHEATHSEQKPFKCKVCQRCFFTNHRLRLHMRNHLNRFLCKHCGKCFGQVSTLLKHEGLHDRVGSFKCEVCGGSFTQMQSLKYHMALHLEKTHQCKYCDKRYQTPKHLKLHINRVHHFLFENSPKPHKCNVCGEGFRFSSLLTAHQARHITGKPKRRKNGEMFCKFCKKWCCSSGGLTDHERIHTGEKPFHCHLCEKQFRQRAHLKTHLLVHSGERRFVCDICGDDFSLKGTLVQHIKIHFKNNT